VVVERVAYKEACGMSGERIKSGSNLDLKDHIGSNLDPNWIQLGFERIKIGSNLDLKDHISFPFASHLFVERAKA